MHRTGVSHSLIRYSSWLAVVAGLVFVAVAVSGQESADSSTAAKPEAPSSVNVRDFGAVGNAAHDDTQAIRAAFADVAREIGARNQRKHLTEQADRVFRVGGLLTG